MTNRNTKKKHKKEYKKAIGAAVIVSILLLIILGFLMYRDAIAPDRQCLFRHAATSLPPTKLGTAMDYFIQGNYDYDVGNCKKAVKDYTNAIELNPKIAEFYNNRAYTFMRMRDYKNALTDLDKAIELRPDYVSALMNRGDIYNFYYQINHAKALVDYNKVISLGATSGNSVCGHKAMAMSNNFIPLVFLRIFSVVNCQ